MLIPTTYEILEEPFAAIEKNFQAVASEILEIKLSQWNLIKIIFPLESSPNLTSIHVRSVVVIKSFFEAQ